MAFSETIQHNLRQVLHRFIVNGCFFVALPSHLSDWSYTNLKYSLTYSVENCNESSLFHRQSRKIFPHLSVHLLFPISNGQILEYRSHGRNKPQSWKPGRTPRRNMTVDATATPNLTPSSIGRRFHRKINEKKWSYQLLSVGKTIFLGYKDLPASHLKYINS